MSRAPATDPLPHLAAVAAMLAAPGQPRTLCAALERATAATLGHRLFTVMRYHADSGESERVYTSAPAAYPVGGRKALNQTPWAQQVLVEQRPYLGRTAADIRAVFFDHALIASLGCASVLNVPVLWDRRTLGTLNLLHEADWYDEGDALLGRVFAALVTPAFL